MPMLRRLAALLLATLAALPLVAMDGAISGTLTDTQGRPIAGVIRLAPAGSSTSTQTATSSDGGFSFPDARPGDYQLSAIAPGFSPIEKNVQLAAGQSLNLDLRLTHLLPLSDSVTVIADVKDIDVLSPDPAEKVYASQDLIDANPGRPGAPISIPGYPSETASSGIKAPQYFAPGVAGDHGEPIAQYIQVGSYLLPNNLSANAHGNGYSDPNILIANVLESVQIDGGAFNVREGNHALNLATTYSLRSHLDPFFTWTLDQRDLTATAGFSPFARSWVAVESSFGNGFLDRPEHRKQFKLNGGQVFLAGHHTLTLFALAYYGFSDLAGLSPIAGFNATDAADGWKLYPDTIDPRQKDSTHTALIAFNDVWKLSATSELQLSGFFRTYNLSLDSDFGAGLIRQSEFRTVTGASAAYQKRYSKHFTLLAGTDYQREAPRRDDLDYYGFLNPAIPSFYGPFTKIEGANVTITPLTPYLAAEGEISPYLHYYLGLRRDEISIDNQDLLTPANSSHYLVGLNSPKATLTFFPRASWWIPEIAVSYGKSFFTEDPRTPAANLVETARSYQMVASKRFHHTDFKITLGHETQTGEYGKIDPDTGLPFDLGPGRIRYLAATVRQDFRDGSLQATFEQADARQLSTGQITPEAPRLIGNLLFTYRKLPFHLQAKAEFEYVGRKVVGNGCDNPSDLASYCLGVPNQEYRLALARPFLEGKLNIGVNMMLARGFTGQTTENFALNPGTPSALPPAENPVAEVVGVRIPSYASVNFTYRFGRDATAQLRTRYWHLAARAVACGRAASHTSVLCPLAQTAAAPARVMCSTAP